MPPALFDLASIFEVDDYLYFYRESLTDERSDAETTALVKLLALEPPMKILDLACGFGRHANRLASMGHSVTGVDLMPGFLELARKDAAVRGVGVDYRQGDMREIDFREEFDRVLVLFTAFGYFEHSENQRVLDNAAKALKAGGLLCFDTHNRDVFLKNMPACWVSDKEGDLMIDRGSFDTLTGRWTNRRIVIRNGIRRDKPFSIQLYNPTEISHMLAQSGLAVHALYGGWDSQPLTSESRRMIVVARK